MLAFPVEITDGEGPELYVDNGQSSSFEWAVANLTCLEAQQNTSGYACVSTNSRCITVDTSDLIYMGYRCECLKGFQGNPYVQNGCTGSDIFHHSASCISFCYVVVCVF